MPSKVMRCSSIEQKDIDYFIKEVSKMEETLGECQISFDTGGMIATWTEENK